MKLAIGFALGLAASAYFLLAPIVAMIPEAL